MMRNFVLGGMLCMHLAAAVAGDLKHDEGAQLPAKPPSDLDFCRNGLFPREQESLSLAVIQGQSMEKIHFFDDFDGCPSKGASCMSPAYLVPGNAVLAGKSSADWTCVWYQGKKREFVAWVPKRNVALLPAPPLHPVNDWIGTWADGANKIQISLLKPSEGLRMSSDLRWNGGTSPDGEKHVNFGGMQGALEVRGAKASAEDGFCQVRLTRIGKYLVVDDNGACGGMNVRHTGLYFRVPK